MKNKIYVTGDGAVQTENSAKTKRLTVMGVEFVYLYLFGIGIANIGWIVENISKIVTEGYFDCRFHLLPFISPYALVPFAFQILLGDPDNIAVFGHRLFKKECRKNKVFSNLVCIAMTCSAVFFGELIVGNLWEALFSAQLWDYSSDPLHITRYAGVIPTVGFGVGAYLIFKFIYKPVLRFLRRKVKFSVAKTICCTLGVAIVLDTLAMAIHIFVLHQPPMYWQIHLW